MADAVADVAVVDGGAGVPLDDVEDVLDADELVEDSPWESRWLLVSFGKEMILNRDLLKRHNLMTNT